MNFLKRATPWMITLVILLGVYVASYVWWYKPNQLTGAITIGSGSGSIHMPLIKTKNTLLDQFYMPLRLCEEERTKQKARKELLRQCQGEWEGHVQLRSEDFTNYYHTQFRRVRASIQGDQFKITWAESMPELVGVSWKIGCEYDKSPNHLGFSSNTSYPEYSSIFLTYVSAPSGKETLREGLHIMMSGGTPSINELVRPATTTTTSSPTP